MRHLLVSLTTLALLSVSGSAVGAQEEEVAPSPAGALDMTGSLALARTGHTATLLPDGRVLITGGDGLDPADLATAEVWDPVTSTFGPAEVLAEPRPEPVVEANLARTDHSATRLPDGRALVVGGTEDGAPTAEAELLTPDSGELLPAGTLAEPRSGHTATFLHDGRVLVVGGSGPDGPLASAELWTSATKPAKCLGKRPTLMAQPGMELVGSTGNDVIAGSVGDDLIRGGGGSDRICGYGGDDTIDGGGGNDRIDAGPGADLVTGGSGKDRLTGGLGDDTLDGGKGKDVCIGGKDADWLPGCNEAKRTRGTVVVTKNKKLKGPHKGRFIIGKNGVTLDCDGHTVTGPGREAGLPGVEVSGRKRVTIRNCDLRQFNDGFRVTQSVRNRFIENRVAHVRQGFTLQSSDRNTLARNAVVDADDYFGYGILNGSDRNRIVGNVAERVIGEGFLVERSQANDLSDNVARGGLKIPGLDWTGNGFIAHTGARGNAFTGNSAIDNARIGFLDNTDGSTGDAGTDNRYEGNHCAGNGEVDEPSSPLGLCD